MNRTAPNQQLSRSIRALAGIERKTPWVLTCYVRLTPADRANRAYLADAKREVRRLEHGLAASSHARDEREAIRKDAQAVLAWLGKADNLPSTHGLALFVNTHSRVFEAVPVTTVIKTRISVNPTPELAELIADEDARSRYLTVVIDRVRARLFDVSPIAAVELVDLIAVAGRGGKYRTDRQDAPGWGERDYHHRLEEERHRHYAAIAAQVKRLMRTNPFRGIAIVGSGEHVEAFRHFLPDDVAAQLLGTQRLNPKSVTSNEVRQVTARLERESEARRHEALVQRIELGLGTGWTVMGIHDTLAALEKGQLRTVVVALNADASAFRCGPGGRLVADAAACAGEEAIPVTSLVNEVIEESLRQRIEVVVIRDQALEQRIPGLAGLCRFATVAGPRKPVFMASSAGFGTEKAMVEQSPAAPA